MAKKTTKDPAVDEAPIDRALNLIVARQQAYQQTFGGGSPFIKLALGDLARFCRANESTFHPDQRVHAVLEGRREVYLRIKQHLEMTAEELQKLYLKEI